MARRDRLEKRIDRVTGRIRKAMSKGKSNKVERLGERRRKLRTKLYTCKTNSRGARVCKPKNNKGFVKRNL